MSLQSISPRPAGRELYLLAARSIVLAPGALKIVVILQIRMLGEKKAL